MAGCTVVTMKDIKPVIITDKQFIRYNAESGTGPMDDTTLNKLVKDINRLNKEDHEHIYITLRKHKPAKFFATHNYGTSFNISQLNDKARWELYSIVQLSMQHKIRNEQIKQAGMQHETTMTHLSDTLYTDNTSDTGADGNTEQERIQSMLRMNGGLTGPTSV